MKDFYSTVPRAGENAGGAGFTLTRQSMLLIIVLEGGVGRFRIQVQKLKLTIFVNNCLDPSLAMSFQLKAPEQWTTAEVQECLDSHTRRVRTATAAHTHYAVGFSAHGQSCVWVGMSFSVG